MLGDDESAKQLAQNITDYRQGLIYGMESIAQIMAIESMNINTFKRIANFITTRSDVFTIRCDSTADRNETAGTSLQTEAVVDRSSTPCEALYWYQGASYL